MLGHGAIHGSQVVVCQVRELRWAWGVGRERRRASVYGVWGMGRGPRAEVGLRVGLPRAATCHVLGSVH